MIGFVKRSECQSPYVCLCELDVKGATHFIAVSYEMYFIAIQKQLISFILFYIQERNTKV